MKKKAVASVVIVFFLIFAVCDAGNHVKPATAYLFGILGVGFMFYAIYARRRKW